MKGRGAPHTPSDFSSALRTSSVKTDSQLPTPLWREPVVLSWVSLFDPFHFCLQKAFQAQLLTTRQNAYCALLGKEHTGEDGNHAGSGMQTAAEEASPLTGVGVPLTIRTSAQPQEEALAGPAPLASAH